MIKKDVQDGWIIWEPDFLNVNKSDAYLKYFLKELPWSGGSIKIFGKEYEIPRKQVFFANDQLSYGYSGKTLLKSEWDKRVLEIKSKIELYSGSLFNACLANLYRDGNDSNGWHADNEKELGDNPIIASISLGAERRFHLKHSSSHERLTFDLSHGSLLIMGGAIQHHWKHQLPKSKKVIQPRVNLTFRNLI